MAATVIHTSNLQETVKEGVALVDFWAPWCGPCKVQLPIVEELSEELAGQAVIGKVNVDEEGELASQFGISSIPTLILFKDGQPVEKMVGLQSKDSLKAKIARYSN
ncbi:thioredoxin [Xylanibacillus composti]|uniref:Thioredoxin n=1 Tax=Xylanibacillus composti TaxID=1572762 RepID=A0A8J4H1F8_9BACL|nr:thioredoxin [Xylanibacillus composti]MDT9725862.1 thioredoxin [Xylanibacillus composti]GIQ69182.1 thioredoxin [Xylanibacillus composti]